MISEKNENIHFMRAFDNMEQFGLLFNKNYLIIEIYDKNKINIIYNTR